VNEPVAAFAVAPKMIWVFAPDASVKGLAGLEMTPAGRPLSEICTLPVNPFSGLTETLRELFVAPC
jgi:hypothetical protein